MTNRRMLAAERRNKLIQIINSTGSIRIGELAALFGVSTETIRKDLIFLSENGSVERSFGGAVSLSQFHEKPLDTRSAEHPNEKRAIAIKALEHIERDRVIFLDSGSTALEVARLITPDMGLSIATNSLSAANVLCQSGVPFNMIGGEFSPITMSNTGFWAHNSISTIRFDIAILGASGFFTSDGPSVKTFADAQLKRDVIAHSNRRIVVADSSKFGMDAVVCYASWRDIDMLITDSGAADADIPCNVIKA